MPPAFSSSAFGEGDIFDWLEQLDRRLDGLAAETLTNVASDIAGEYRQTLSDSIKLARAFAFENLGPRLRPPAVLLEPGGVIEFVWRSMGMTVEVTFEPGDVRVWTRNRMSTDMWGGSLEQIAETLPRLLALMGTSPS